VRPATKKKHHRRGTARENRNQNLCAPLRPPRLSVFFTAEGAEDAEKSCLENKKLKTCYAETAEHQQYSVLRFVELGQRVSREQTTDEHRCTQMRMMKYKTPLPGGFQPQFPVRVSQSPLPSICVYPCSSVVKTLVLEAANESES
jgi:hypothetical protein